MEEQRRTEKSWEERTAKGWETAILERRWDVVLHPKCPERMGEHEGWKLWYRFLHQLNLKRYEKRNYKRYKLGIESGVFLERGENGQYHFHAVLNDVGSLSNADILKTWFEVGGFREAWYVRDELVMMTYQWLKYHAHKDPVEKAFFELMARPLDLEERARLLVEEREIVKRWDPDERGKRWGSAEYISKDGYGIIWDNPRGENRKRRR